MDPILLESTPPVVNLIHLCTPLDSECAGPTQVCHEKLTNNTNPMLSARRAGSYAVGKMNQSGVSADYVEEAGRGTDAYQDDAQSLKARSRGVPENNF